MGITSKCSFYKRRVTKSIDPNPMVFLRGKRPAARGKPFMELLAEAMVV
jgi:hypothetical protein